MDIITKKQPISSSNGIVTSNHPIASSVGISILAAGGNAFDAAVGTAFALSVVEPMMVGPFGGGFTNFYKPESGFSTIDGYCSAPGKAYETMFNPISNELDQYFEVEGQLNTIGYLASGTPGNLLTWTHLVEKHGKFPLSEVINPAINIARNGFRVSDYLSNNIRDNVEGLSQFKESKDIYLPNGIIPEKNQIIKNPNFATTLEGIAKYGSDYLHGGELGRHIEEEMKKNDGLITLDDLVKQKIYYRDSIVGTYKNYTINSVAPVSSGGICLIQMLNILENFEIEKYKHSDPERIHIIAETFKIVFADRYKYIGDPEYIDIPIKSLLSKKYATQRARQINLKKSQVYQYTEGLLDNESNNTTHFNVADNEGNIVSMTQTINNAFGSRVAINETGMMMNNCMLLFDPHKGNANSIKPYKRSLSSMTPTIITKNNKPFLALGTPGGRRIFGAVCQALIAIIDNKFSLQSAVESPRIWTDGYELELEYEFPQKTVSQLTKLGHKTNSVNRVAGGMNAILFKNDIMEGAACHRADGSPAGLSGGFALPSKPGDTFRDY
tara:strand:+ start:59 stop:1720 length:1662 start_codon:yes stop_codon:yes gene_type:complete